MIPFNIPPCLGTEQGYITEAIASNKICGDGDFTKKCNDLLIKSNGVKKALLTTSCTHALEMAAILADIQPGDEVIMPSYTFVSTANAFVLRGAKIVFVDIRSDTMNIDENLIEAAITDKTKAIVAVHYAGVACEMDTVLSIAKKHNLIVIEDAAQGVSSAYKGQALGAIGDIGCYSFHETKNYSMGEGGALMLRDDKHLERAEIIREKGTNRSCFLRGQVDKYTWVDIGSSYLPSDINAAYLYGQLLESEKINNRRLELWDLYFSELSDVKGIDLPFIPGDCVHNAHMFYIKLKNIEQRTHVISELKKKDIQAVFHYVPLHSSPAGEKLGRFSGKDIYTTSESERLMRLPMFYSLKEEDVLKVTTSIKEILKA